MWRLVLALALVSCSTPAARADELQADPRLLEACIAATNHAALEGCRGVVARACIEAEGGGSMADVLCWSAEADAWRGRIDAYMQRMNAEHAYRDPARLASAHQAWQAWADAECEYWAWEEGGGSGEQYARVQCAASLAADRAISLIAR